MDVRPGVVTFDRVDKTYSGRGSANTVALADITFALSAGEFVSIVGPSGSGKTTILRLAAGLDHPTSGTVRFHDEVVRAPDRRRGLVFQAYNVFPWLTVRDNVAFGLRDQADKAAHEHVDRWLELAGLTDFADAYPKTLSGGMRQRVALARTMVVEPEMLLLDEPLGALDEHTRRGMQAVLTTLVAQLGCSVLLVTHDVREAILMANRVLLLSRRPGRIIRTYDVPALRPRTREFMRTPEFNALYEEILEQFGQVDAVESTKG